MSNIYEALQQAQREKKRPLPTQPVREEQGRVEEQKPVTLQKRRIPEIPMPEDYLADSVELDAEKEMVSLYQSIVHSLADYPRKIIQFIGSVDGEGVSTIVREFAKLLATKLGKTVLILDAAHRRPTQHLFCEIAHEHGWKDVVEGSQPVDKGICYAGVPNLFLSPIAQDATLPSHIYNLPVANRFLLELKQKFDFVLIDSSAATSSPDCLAITRSADGVVLVVAAEKTRWQVVESVKAKIEKNGGNIIGMVLNKRRYYIPKSFYRHL
ncbi:CpsD/CapB family tyrosine-protein kinase [Geobacter sp. DSM 9736]|uniref:CpsD/CapB family tyrosine-protein kinase n=1 Tax=Geobacter sp. DSM 9736 TaxID=1277350 RepID=UPI000B500F88|nr:CpsD/CapB family tyrosine-protein kinase [Geobacter sp. DSM 9736]SNB46144.1 Chromosome partitioning ATPase, Mrp family, contains Fe-S cluster [Geobacter sp. DSM 9736]